MNLKNFVIFGYVQLKSNFSIEEIGQILSDKIFGGLQFGGKEFDIHEEIPAIFIQSPILGLEIILDGFTGFDEGGGFSLSVEPWIKHSETNYNHIRVDNYLFQTVKAALIEFPGIQVIENIYNQ